jgi:hypothetical protein
VQIHDDREAVQVSPDEKTRHQPHQPLIGSEMPVDMVAEVPLTGLSSPRSITDACIGWEETVELLHLLAAAGPG